MKRNNLLNCLSIIFVIGLIIHQSALVYAAGGDLDFSFGFGGKIRTDTGYNDKVNALATQPDGKIVVAGERDINGAKGLIARYNADGSLDESFGFGGFIADAAHGGHGTIFHAVLVQPDGKIVAAGNFNESSAGGCPHSQSWIVRYNPNGSNDTTFGGGDGKVEYPYVYVNGCPVDSFHYALAIQNDGKILAAGTSKNSFGDFDFAAMRLNTDGSLDTSFNLDGKGIFPISTTVLPERAYAVAVQSDGRIVLAGHSYSNVTISDFALIMLNSQGLYDWNFGGTGKVTTDIGGDENAYAVAFQGDGKIVAAGRRVTNANSPSLVRYNTNGSLDGSFGFGGKVATDCSLPCDGAYGMALQSNGRIVAVGRDGIGTSYNFAVFRYRTGGSLDSTFSGDGQLMTDFTNYTDHAWEVVIQADGKIVVAGSSSNGIGGYNSIALARYLP